MTFIAGRYTSTWNALSAGQVADGYRLSPQLLMRNITGDGGGQTVQDAVYQGAGVEIGFTIIEYDAAAVQTLIWPVSATLFDMGVIGKLAVAGSLAKQLVLTRVSSSTTASPATLTLPLTMLKENYPVNLLMASDLKEVPLLLRVFPNSSGVFGTQT